MIEDRVRLFGDLVALEPLALEHESALFEAAQDPEVWTWICGYPAESAEAFRKFVFGPALAAAERGEEVPFATRRLADERVVGSTRYLAIRSEDRAREIGWTWLEPSAWRTGVNTEAKLLMLEHCFEELGCVRVEFKTDARNERSRAALLGIGAQFEGVFRKHRIVPGVGQRDSAYFSVIDDEWPAVRERLKERLDP